jgi:hypothetical protein
MKILHEESLIATVDAFNEAVFFGRPWQREAGSLVAWVSARLGQRRAYAGSFALTEDDWSRDFRLFTGEKVSTKVARAHIMAEEATRMLNTIRNTTGLDSDARKTSEERLARRIFDRPDSTTTMDGIYCCGKCSVSFWRCLLAGGYAGNSSVIVRGVASLAAARDGSGGWNRFPFYYTLLFLAEADRELSKHEIEYCAARLHRARRLLRGKRDWASARRSRLIDLLVPN